MSFSFAMTSIAKPKATRIGMSGRGSTTRRLPSRAVGIDRSSFFSAKYEAKKMQRKTLAISIGWNCERADVHPQPGVADVGGGVPERAERERG